MGLRAVVVSTLVLATLAGGAVVGDRWARGEAEERVAAQVRDGVDGVTGEPDVEIGGSPFLTQLASGSLETVSVALVAATLSGVELQDVDLRARGVSTSEPYTAQAAQLTGTLPVATLEGLVRERTDLGVSLAVVDGRLTATLELLGLDLIADLVPTAQERAIAVDVGTVTVGGFEVDVDDLPRAAAARLQDVTVPVDGLPEGVVLTDVAVHDGGLRIAAEGTDVTLPAAP